MAEKPDSKNHFAFFRIPLPPANRVFFVFLVISLALLLGGADPAPAPASASTPQGESIGVQAAAQIWNRHRQYLEKNERRRSLDELENLYQWRLDQGIPNLFFVSAALIRETGDSGVRDDPETVSALLNYAEKMAPDFSQVKIARSGFLWFRHFPSPGDMLAAFWEYGHGVYLSLANPVEAVPQWANVTSWFLVGFLLTFLFFSLSLLVRFYPFFLHHLGHILRLDARPGLLYPLGTLLLFSPLWIGLPWMWLPALWFLVFWMYAPRGDRVVMIALILLLFLLPSGLRIHSALITSLGKNGTPEIAAAQYGAWSAGLYEKLLVLRQKYPRDADILASAALVEKRMGKYREAEENFQEALRLNSGNAALVNNLGNVYLATNRTPEAIDAYRRAAQLKPKSAVPLYNLGQAHMLNLRLNEAEAEFRRAREIEPDLVSYYTGIASRKPNRQAVDQPMELGRFWKRVGSGGADDGEIGPIFWSHFWAGTPLRFGEWTVAALAVLLGLVFRITRGRPVAGCERCGRVICSRCARSRVLGNQCSQCVHAFSPNPNRADPETVKGKRAEVLRYRESRRMFLRNASLVIPGSGHLIGGRPLEGLIYVFLFFLFLTKALFWHGIVGGPLGAGLVSELPGKILAGLLFILFYLFVQYRARVRRKGGDFDFRPA